MRICRYLGERRPNVAYSFGENDYKYQMHQKGDMVNQTLTMMFGKIDRRPQLIEMFIS